MADSFNTDGMFDMPVIEDNCFESIERAIAFDSQDWSTDRRLAWIYGIVFGWEDAEQELKIKHGWTNEDIERLNKYHKQWEIMKEKINALRGNEDGTN